jgi:hypothetical protein
VVLIAEHKAAIKAVTQFSHQVELNMKVKELQSRLLERTTML